MTNEELIEHIKYSLKIGADVTLTEEDAKQIIKALEQNPDLKEAYRKGYKDGQEALAFHLELCKEEGSIITFPEGATNGEVFEKLMREAYPKAFMIYERNDDTKTIKPIFSEEWWNSPYRKEQEWQSVK